MIEITTRLGRFISPFQVYVRCSGYHSAADMPALLGSSYKPCKHVQRGKLATLCKHGKCAIACHVGDWLMLGDDTTYSLWHRKQTRQAIRALASRFDVFAFLVGDSDLSFDFSIFQNGRCLREVRVESPNYNDRVLSKDVGGRMQCELDLENIGDGGEYLGIIAASLGIRQPNQTDPAMLCCPRWKSLLR